MNEWFEAEQHVERAHELFEAGRLAEAEVELRAALTSQPDQTEWLFNLGLTLEAAGRYEPAIEAFERVWSLQNEGLGSEREGEPNAMLMIGSCLMRLDDPAGALVWIERAVKAKPDDPEPRVYMVETLARLGRHDDAEVAFYIAQQLDAERADLYIALADSLLDRGLHERAVWCLREASRLDPALPRINARLAEAYASTGRLERARQLYLAELRLEPGDTDVLLDMGDLLVDMHRFEEASEKYRRVLEIQPHHAGAHESLGELAARLGRVDEAVRSFDVVLRLDSEYPGARTRLATTLLQRAAPGDLAKARTLLVAELSARRASLEAAEIAATPAPARAAKPASMLADDAYELGRLFVDAGQHKLAIPLLEQAVAVSSHDAKMQHALSVALFRNGSLSEGMEHARKALSMSPSMFAPMHNLALASMEQRDWLRAWYWVRRARKVDSDEAGLRRLRLKLQLRWASEMILWFARSIGRTLRRIASVFGRPTRAAWTDPS